MNKIVKIFAFAALLSVLISSIAYGFDYDLQTENATQTIMNVPYYYVDNNTSDVDSDPDKGTQSNFTAQRYAPDSVYDTLTEEGAPEIIEDYVDNDASDVDSSADIGSLVDFNNMKATDSTYANLTETASGGSITFINEAEASATTGTSAQVNKPTNTQEGDFMIALLASTLGSDTDGSTMFSAPSGWTLEHDYTQNAISGQHVYIYWKVAGASEPSSYTWTWTDSCGWVAQITTFRGVDTASPIHAEGTVNQESSASPLSPSVTTTVDNAMIYLYDMCDGAQIPATGGAPGGTTWIDQTEVATPGNGLGISTAYFVQASAGATGDQDWTLDAIDENSGQQYALKPASSGYHLDQEVQFISVIDFLSIEKLCICMGTMDAEALNVSYWTGSSWSLLDSDLTASSWNNYSVSLIGVNFTIRFETETLTGDSSADEFQVDAVLLQVSGVGSKEDPIDQQSDIDSSPDIGTHSNFTAQQYGPDSIYDTLTEEDTGGGSTTFGKTDVGASSRGFTGYLEASRYQCGQDFTVTKILLYLSGTASGYYARTAIYSDSSGAPGSLLGESAEQEVASDGWHEFTGFNVAVSQNTYYWLAFQISTSNLAYYYDTGVANQHAYRAYTYGSFPSTFGSPSYAAEAQSIYAASSVVNYEIDVEIQWDDLPNSLPNEELCIRTGTFSGSETIQVKVWNNTGSSWDWIMNLTANQWNNVSITDCLTSNQFTIQFLGGNETGDSTEDTWEIDLAIIQIWNAENYEIDLEIQWTNVDYSEANEELCIYFDEASQSTNSHSLDATGGYMIVGDGTPDWGSTAGTISFWGKMDGTVQGRFWGQNGDMETRWSGTNLVLDWGSDTTLTSATSFSANSWYFIAIVWDENNDNLFLYVGDETNPPTLDSNSLSGTWTSTTPLSTENRFMNGLGASEPVDGHGDDLRYWNVARSLAELQSDYNVTLTGSESNLRSYFKLNDNFDDIGPDNNDGSGSGSYSFSTDVPFTSTNETLRVDVWNGSTWQNVFPQLANGWNNATITAYLTSSTLTARFKGNSETSDSTQDSWNIDSAVIHAWT